MKISGFTFARDAVRFGYPIVESIQSMLPICDEVVVAVGNSNDGTLKLIQNIGSEKIRIIETVWDERLREGGRILAQQTNIALSHCRYDWCLYLQADEVLHEQFYSNVMDSTTRYVDDQRVQGLLFDYVHFYGSYWTVGTGRNWYQKEIRLVRNHIGVESYRDAQGFRLNGNKLQVKHTDAKIYHYGWAKPPGLMIAKQKNLDRFWHSDENVEKKYSDNNFHIFSALDEVELFKGTHPKMFAGKIPEEPHQELMSALKNRKRKKSILRWLEENVFHTRFGEYKNYKLLH
ncbi:MAG: glycosyltransferase family 2 protein [Bacteroidota bacterium]|nr:glycosyltransferase family 2 protein [Bacteroidota bacterium]